MSNHAPPTSPPLLVIIVSTNDGKWLRECFAALSASSYRRFSVLLIDNRCTDETVRECRSAAVAVTVVKTDRRGGFAECNNIGLRLALEKGYQYAMLLNPDTKIHPDGLLSLVDFLERNEEYGIAGSQQIKYEEDSWSRPNGWTADTLGEARRAGNLPREAGAYTVVDHNYVQGAALMLRVGLLPRIGLLDPIYVTFYEETDLCRRCLLAGRRVGIVLESKVKHFEGGNWKRSARDHMVRDHLFLRNQFLYFLSLPSGGLKPLRTFLSILADQARVVRRKEKAIILPAWRYPSVLLAFLKNARYLRLLRRRNRAIIAGRLLEESDLAIGPPPAAATPDSDTLK